MRVFLSKMLAIGAGLIVSIGSVAAQQPAAQPAPAPVAQPSPAVVVAAPVAGGCNSCGTTSSCGDSKHSHRFKDAFCIGKGTAMPVTCACTASQRSFVFGSCNQFYNPGNDCRRCGFGRGDCRNPVGGPPAGPVPPCTYGSYTVR